MVKFEYKKELNPSIEDLNREGLAGWELVSVYKIHPENINVIFIFKRELRV